VICSTALLNFFYLPSFGDEDPAVLDLGLEPYRGEVR
jgi:hypothetical protein